MELRGLKNVFYFALSIADINLKCVGEPRLSSAKSMNSWAT